MSVPPLTPGLIERLEGAVREHGWDSLRRASELEGDPYGVTLYEKEGLRASVVRALPELPWFNAVSGLTQDTLAELDGALALYRSARIGPRLGVWATQLTPALGAALFDRGFTPVGMGTTLYAAATAPAPRAFAGVEVRELKPGEDGEGFDAALLAGYGFTDPLHRELAVLENGGPGVRRYLALVDGQPAAAATLSAHDGVAFLAGAATRPEFRQRGAQAALIHRRLEDAARSCELVTVTAAFASASQRNLERYGLRVAQLKTLWAARSSVT